MTGVFKTLLTCASIFFLVGNYVNAETPKHDEKVAEAAAKKAAAKIGTIRGTIDHDKAPQLVTPSTLEKKSTETSLLPRPAWVPVPGKKALPPMVSNNEFGIDHTMTGSIGKNSDQTIVTKPESGWEKFDRYGNLIPSDG